MNRRQNKRRIDNIIEQVKNIGGSIDSHIEDNKIRLLKQLKVKKNRKKRNKARLKRREKGIDEKWKSTKLAGWLRVPGDRKKDPEEEKINKVFKKEK